MRRSSRTRLAGEIDEHSRGVDTGRDRAAPAADANAHERSSRRRLGVAAVGVAEPEERDEVGGIALEDASAVAGDDPRRALSDVAAAPSSRRPCDLRAGNQSASAVTSRRSPISTRTQ